MTVNITLGLIAYILVALGLGGLGFFLIFTSHRNKQKALASADWPVVSGEVTHTTVHVNGGQDGHFRYIPQIQYVYQVGAQVYDGDRRTFGRAARYKTHDEAEGILARYPVEGVVNVYYNPQKPEEAVLERGFFGSSSDLITGIVLILVMASMGCGLVVFFRYLW